MVYLFFLKQCEYQNNFKMGIVPLLNSKFVMILTSKSQTEVL